MEIETDVLAEHSEGVRVNLSFPEIAMLVGCMNETVEALDGREFANRIGQDRELARILRDQLSDLYKVMARGLS